MLHPGYDLCNSTPHTSIAWRLHRLGFPLAQLVALEFPGSGARQVGPHVDPTWIFPQAGPLLHVHPQHFEQSVGGRIAVAQHDEGLGLDQAVSITLADDGGFEYRLVRGQGRLDFEWRDPHAAHLEHVVRAAAIMIITIGIAQILVAGVGPFTREGATALGALIPVAFARCRPTHDEFTDLAVRHFKAVVLVHDLQIVAGDRLSGRSIAQVVWPVAQVGLEHFCRADAIDDIDAARGAPALAELYRQSLTGRHAKPQPIRTGAWAHVVVGPQR